MLPEEQEGLRKIRRRRAWFWFFLLSYVPVVWIVIHLTRNELALVPFVLIWVVGIVVALSRSAFSQCPRCGNLFHSTTTTPTVYNIVARKCLRCGLPLKAGRVIYPNLEA